MYSTRLAVTAATLLLSAALVDAQEKGGKKQGPPPMTNIKVADFADGAHSREVHLRSGCQQPLAGH
jgi:hypothetical protein